MNKVSTNCGLKIFKYKSSCTVNKFPWEAKWTLPVWDFKPAWKQVLFKWSFISAAFQNDPIFWWTYVDISFRVVLAYFITQNEISFLSKWPILNPYPQSFKRTCALNATTSLRLFISFRVNYVHMKIQCRFDISFRSNWPVWKLYLFEF